VSAIRTASRRILRASGRQKRLVGYNKGPSGEAIPVFRNLSSGSLERHADGVLRPRFDEVTLSKPGAGWRNARKREGGGKKARGIRVAKLREDVAYLAARRAKYVPFGASSGKTETMAAMMRGAQ
jgi:hypothetical protein